MRKITYLAGLLLVATISASAQTVLKYETHAMKNGDVLALNVLDSISAGAEGKNQVWDYSGANIGKSYTIYYNADAGTKYNSGEAFACNQNNESFPVFNMTSTQKLYYGISASGFKLSFDKPMVELQFPFKYGDKLGENLTGTYTLGENSYPLTGSYSVKADAFGKLILPNGKIFNNVLRVRTEYIYNFEINGSKYFQKTVRYAFFSESSRYALLQILNTQFDCSCGCKSNTTNVYFNPAAEPAKETQPGPIELPNGNIASNMGSGFSYKVGPNPFEDQFTVTYTLSAASKVKITLLDLSGKEVKQLENAAKEAGEYVAPVEMLSGQAQTYILRMQVGDKVYTEKLIKKVK